MNLARNARSGFSLIEIVIAVTIMAIVAALVVPNVMNYLKKSQVRSTKVALENVKGAIENFNADTGSYPTNLSELKTRPADEKLAKRWDGPYIEKEPLDAWKRELVYTLNPKGTQPRFELYSWGQHGEDSPQEEWINVREE